VVDEVPNAPALLQEALERAVAGGHDALAADIINEVLLTQTHGEQRSTPEIAHLVAAARGLVARSGGDERQLGNLALNEASLLRRAGRIDQAMARDLQAEAHFTSIGDEDGVARARVNQLVSLMRLGQVERVSRELPRTLQALEEASGAASPAASQGRSILYGALSYAGRMHEAFAVADASYQQVRERFTPQSYTFRQAAIAHVMAAANIGRTDLARETLVFVRAAAPLPEDKALALDVIELVLLESEREHDEILRRLPVLAQHAARLHDDETAMTLDMMDARSLFLLGRHEEARATLASPSLLRLRDGANVLPDLLSDLAVLGVLSGAPPPPGHEWRSIAAAEKTPMLTNRRLLEAVEAIASAPDPVPLVREVRDELARVCHANDVDVQLLDAWLATRERDATP
jgi:tetratricopeptide (TPR) repeat protein